MSNGGAPLTAANDQFEARINRTTYCPKPSHDLESIARVAFLDSLDAERELRAVASASKVETESAAAVLEWWKEAEANTVWSPVFAAARSCNYEALKTLLNERMPKVRNSSFRLPCAVAFVRAR